MRFKVFQSHRSTLDQAVGIAVVLEAFKQAEKHVREFEIGEKTQFGDGKGEGVGAGKTTWNVPLRN